MFSRNRVSRLISGGLSVVILLVNLTGCSKFLDEKKDSRQTLELDSEKFGCLKQIPGQLNQFLDGTISKEELNSGIDCSKEGLSYFSKKTKGSVDNGYAPEDLRNFFGKYFLKENNLTAGFTIELFKVKKMIFGGSATALTKPEIEKIVELLEMLKAPLALLAPHMPRLLIKAPAATLEQLTESESFLTKVLLAIVNKGELVNSQYTVQDLKNLLEELNKFLSQKKPFEFYATIQANTSLMESIKNIFIGEVAHFEGLADWERAVKTLTGLHLEFLRYHYVLDTATSSPQEKSQAQTLVVDDGLKLVASSLPMKQQGRISFKDIDGLLDQLDAKKLLPAGLTADAVKNLYKLIVLRAFDSKRKGDARDLEAFERAHFMALQNEWRIFKLHQIFLDSLPYDKNQTISLEQMSIAAKNEMALRGVIHGLTSESLEQNRLWIAWKEGEVLLLKDFPAMYDPKGRAVVVLKPQLYRQSWSSLQRWNIVRALSRLMMQGYGTNTSAELAKDYILVAGLQQWYADFRDAGIQIKAFDPRSENSGSRSFKEANFFTFHGDGNSEMNFQETFDFVSLLGSGGMVSAEDVRAGMLAHNCGLHELDVFGYPWLSEECFKFQLRSNIAVYFANLPGLVAQVQTMTPAEWDEFYTNLMKASRTSDPTAGKVETADIRTAVMILHYAESLMVVYDKNANGKLDVNEVRLAAPRFQEFMAKASPDFVQKFGHYFPKSGHALVEDFFMYLVFRGKKPQSPLSDYYIKFQYEKKRGSLGEVSRDRILQVFKILKDEAADQ